MSMRIVTRGFKELQRSLKKLEGEQRVAAQQALNRVATTVQGEGARTIAAEMGGARMKDVKAVMSVRKASRVHAAARISIREKAIGLEKLRRQTKVRKRRGKRAYDVTYKGKAIKGAFRIPELTGEGAKVIFRKEGRKLKRLFGYTTTQEVERGGKKSPAVKAMEKKAFERFPIEFDRALANRLRRLGM